MSGVDGGAREQFVCGSAGGADQPELLGFAGCSGGGAGGAGFAGGADECGVGGGDAAQRLQGGGSVGEVVILLVPGKLRLYFVDIAKDTAFEVVEVGKPKFFLQFADGLGAAATHFAMDDNMLIAGDAVAVVADGGERDEFAADVDDLEFMRFADVDEL